MSVQGNVGNALLKSLISLRENKGKLNIEDVGALFEQMASSLHPGNGMADQFLKQEIEKLAQFIDSAKQEVSALGTDGEGEGVSRDAAAQLDAVVKATEEASNAIMDAADAISTLAAKVEGEVGAKIVEEAQKLYEACTFQDITGQRVGKVVKTIGEIEARVNKILSLFGAAGGSGAAAAAKVIPINDESALLNGPQLNAVNQDDIDKLFGS